MMAAMMIVPLAYFFQTPSDAAAVPALFKANLLLTAEPSAPLFDQIHKLERPVIATYVVRGREDLWSICKRFHVDQFSIRSSNDLDVSGFDDGTAVKITYQKSTL